jgi:hypothetical protein
LKHIQVILVSISVTIFSFVPTYSDISTPNSNTKAFRKLVDTRIQEIATYKPTDPQEESQLISDLAYNQLKTGNKVQALKNFVIVYAKK